MTATSPQPDRETTMSDVLSRVEELSNEIRRIDKKVDNGFEKQSLEVAKLSDDSSRAKE